MTHSLKTKKQKPKAAEQSGQAPQLMTWVCGAAKFNLEQVSEEEGGGGGAQVVTICAPELLNHRRVTQLGRRPRGGTPQKVILETSAD